MRLKNKIAIVTGAGKGIGRGIAKVFAQEGATVIIATLGEDEGTATEKEIAESGGQAWFIQTDVSKIDSIQNMVQQVVKRYGRIDILVNNAGVTLFKTLLDATVEDWEFVMNIDLRGVFFCSKYVASEMIKGGIRGSIINISSNHAIATLPDTEIYAAAKAGVIGMTKSMALSLGKYGIRVNAICPGFTDTPHLQNWFSKQEAWVRQGVNEIHALGRIGTPEDVGYLAVYLASDESEMMTGGQLVLDGGVTARLYNSLP
ncbi:SDR family NAD(P)-dependent oxidoreductase [Thermoflavimicrobium dichotomicum]|uniref:NAD(P)-dependent dehydrogenase, short-chain alcohol dehydrogenase family n=1 Tax=Thermoflavimicrobium dichotomicum TaxID=46223 RepID=A0A1I3P8F2_9BACL|nr:glucose 1-dehydrogenase [Thermoflavimicrobium dichotomicum]SFJ17828.1 hypothetical protein SAMN05421852_105136 [Thermoflavimicrobium dichotomicum]